MSFQLNKPSKPQTKLALVCGDHINHDGVLVSRLIPITLDLFNTKQSPPRLGLGLELLDKFSKRKQQKRSLDDHNCEETMNRKNGNNKVPRLDLKLNLSPSSSSEMENQQQEESPNRSSSISPTGSCLSSESSPKATSMVLVGCPRCLMYVMLSQDDPKCPKCKSTVLLDFFQDNNHHNHHHHHDDNDDDKNNRYDNGCFKKIRKSLFY